MRFRLFVLIFFMFFLHMHASAHADELKEVLAGLEKSMRSIQSMQTDFTQTKHLSMFQEPVLLKGAIAMEKPDRFAWNTRSPVEYSIVFEKDKARQWNGDTGKIETIPFSAMPILRMIAEQMQTWFYGAYGDLMEQYAVQIESRDPLALKFTPLESSPAYGMVGSVTIRLKNDKSYIESMKIEERNGDVSVMEFQNTVLNTPIDPEVWKIRKRA